MAKNEDVRVFRTFDEFLPPDLFARLVEFNRTAAWTYDETITWFVVDTSPLPLAREVVAVINEKTGTPHEPVRSYANGMVSRSLSKPHYDSHAEADRTFLLYGHAHWDAELWGGETVFNRPIDTWIKAVPNSAVYFSAKHHLHRAYAPQPGCQATRITHVWKLRSLD
jgi:hypothetical protein